MKIYFKTYCLIIGLVLFVGKGYASLPEYQASVDRLLNQPELQDSVFNTRGEAASFVYNGYPPLKDKPIKVFYYFPSKGNLKTMPILFSFHGAERDGSIQLNAWKYFAEKEGFIVIAPQFSKELYDEAAYQFGGIFTTRASKTLNTKEKWTYNMVESLFDFFLKETGSKAKTYNMFGHSAGSQFVHRFLIAMSDARVNKAVAANSGSWTFPYINGIEGTDGKYYGWPYSIKGTPFANKESLKKFLNRKLFIQLGQLDTSVTDKYLPKNAPSMAQGHYRLERGRNYFQACKKIAEELNTSFNFQIAEVEDSNHSTLRMVYGRKVKNREDISNLGLNAAVSLLFNAEKK